MKLVIKDQKTEKDKQFYDEFLFVATFHKRVRKKPTKKVRLLSTNYKIGLGICLGYSFLLIVLGLSVGFDFLDYLFIGMFIILGFIYARSLSIVNNRLKLYMTSRGETTFEITKKEVKVEKETQKLQLDWDSIQYVIVNKYSITFLPKDETIIMIGISTEYKDQVLEEIKKLNKEELLIDNTKKYK